MKNTKKSRKTNKRNRHLFGKFLAVIQIILSIAFMAVLLMINILPMKYMIILFGILMFLDVFALGSQYTRSAHVVGKMDCVLMIVLLLVGNIYLFRANATLLNITNTDYKVDRIAIAVLAESPAQSLADAANLNIGAQMLKGSDKVEQAIAEVSEEIGTELSYESYDDVYKLVDDLYKGYVQVIVYNTAYNESLEEKYEGFSSDVRELKNIEIKTKVETSANSKGDVTKETFTIYISGIDTEGNINTTSRSDVNMLVTINPKTKQILMTSIPRDYYVVLPGISDGEYDKLTHAGLYGVECSKDTLAQLFGIEIDHYARVNFTTLRDMVNALGGVDLDSRYEFTTRHGNYYFTEGMNYDVDGEAALAFARERYSLPNGDNDRVINQQIVLKGIINKCISPAILTGYMGIMESLSDSFETSMSQAQISSLVRMQLSDGASWEMMSSRVVGTGTYDYCFSTGSEELYVMIPNMDSVNMAADLIERMESGEVITEAEVSAAMSEFQ